MKSLSCPNRQCSLSGKSAVGHIIRYGFYTTKAGKRRRYQCQVCGKTFCSTCGTPYYRLQHRRATFDAVASLSVEGVNKSAIARVKRLAWNTVHRWLEKAAAWCRRFNNRKIKGLSIGELQADEIRTIVGGKEQSIWIFVVIDVRSRLWPSTMVGKRSCRNTVDLFRDVSDESAAGSFDHHRRIQVLRESSRTSLWSSVCLWSGHQNTQERSSGQSRAKSCDRSWDIEASTEGSEDSEKLNTSFVERVNLTIRLG
jgi:transposase-like protein